MDCLETWEIPLTSACEQTGRSGRRLNNDPGPEGPSDLPGAQVAKHAILIPHRPGCADFPLPVLHGRALLAEVQMTPSVTCRQRKTRGRTAALVSILASSATRCRFVDRFVRLKVLSRVSRQRFSPHGTPLSSIGSR